MSLPVASQDSMRLGLCAVLTGGCGAPVGSAVHHPAPATPPTAMSPMAVASASPTETAPKPAAEDSLDKSEERLSAYARQLRDHIAASGGRLKLGDIGRALGCRRR